eukprot:2113772-Pleurochrysis_carterae.AAC.5
MPMASRFPASGVVAARRRAAGAARGSDELCLCNICTDTALTNEEVRSASPGEPRVILKLIGNCDVIPRISNNH